MRFDRLDNLKKRNSIFGKIMGEYSIVLITLIMVLVATLLEGGSFFSLKNFVNILRNGSVQGIIAFGMSFVIISGNIDLSVGSQLVAAGIACLATLNATGNIFLAMFAAVALSIALSTLTGIIVTKGRVPSFIVTLGMQNILRSVSIFVMNARGITGENKSFQLISNSSLGGWLPMPIIYFLIVFAVYFYISRFTVIGRRIYAVGSNEKATRLSGINTDMVKIISFILLGISVAIAAITEASRMNSINSTSSGINYELNAIAMTVVGGISMVGGKGNLIGTLFGIFILGIINNILTLVGMDVYLVTAVKGSIIILAVLLQHNESKN